MKRGSPAVAVVVPVVSKCALPLVQLPPVYLVRIRQNEPWLMERPMANDDTPKELPQRRLLAPGTYKVTHNIVIESGELTLEQLQKIIVLANAPVRAQAQATEKPEASPEELERRRILSERARNLTEAYREMLGDGPPYLPDSLEQWLKEGWNEADLRSAFAEASQHPSLATLTKGERYRHLRDVLRDWRMEGKR